MSQWNEEKIELKDLLDRREGSRPLGPGVQSSLPALYANTPWAGMGGRHRRRLTHRTMAFFIMTKEYYLFLLFTTLLLVGLLLCYVFILFPLHYLLLVFIIIAHHALLLLLFLLHHLLSLSTVVKTTMNNNMMMTKKKCRRSIYNNVHGDSANLSCVALDTCAHRVHKEISRKDGIRPLFRSLL